MCCDKLLCINEKKRCNGIKDCEDGSDELFCFQAAYTTEPDTVSKGNIDHIISEIICKL